jgi:hypothetical protein
MTETFMEIPGSFGAKRPSLFTPDRTRDCLADYCEKMWPVGRRKTIERLWGLSSDEARAVCEGSASQRTLDKVWRAGGWPLVLAIFTHLLGEGVDQHFSRERDRHAEIAGRIAELAEGARAQPDPRMDQLAAGDTQRRLGAVAHPARTAAAGTRRPPLAASQGRGGSE